MKKISCTHQLTNWVPEEKLECFKEDLKKGNRSYIIKEIDSNKIQSGYSEDQNFYSRDKYPKFYAIFTTGLYQARFNNEKSKKRDSKKSKFSKENPKYKSVKIVD